MRRRTRPVGPALACAAAGFALLTLTACPDDPYDPQTWIDKLESPAELERAVTELQRLEDPVAIAPLTKTWEKHNRPSKVLRVIIDLADQPDKEGGPFWDDAVPALVTAVEEFDQGDRRSIEDAVVAARALGRAGDKKAIQPLISAATKKMPKLSQGQRVRVAALGALGKFGSDGRAVDTLIKVLQADPKQQPLQLHAAAANALADTGSPKSIQPLLRALYEMSPIYQQVRTALTRVGKPAIPELIKVFKGEHEAINKFAKKQGFATDCDKAIGPETRCKAPGNLQFKAAAVLGDMRAKRAAPVLASALGGEAKVAFFDPKTGAPGPPSHNAILDSLAKIGDDRALDSMYEYWRSSKTDDGIRPFAIDKYSMLARGSKGMGKLAAYMKDDGQEEDLRKSAALAYARLVHEKKQLGPLNEMIKRYKGEANKYEARAEKAKDEDKKAGLMGQAQGYRGFQQLFEQHKARALVGIDCGEDAACYGAYLDIDPDPLADKMQKLGLEGAVDLGGQAKTSLQIAAQERALLELAKLEDKGRPALDNVLIHADATDRIIREGVLLAMTQIADKPCKKCVERLSEVVELQKDQTTLDYLTGDTRIVKHYFMWAGKDE